jgi:hypothetical protein
MDPARMFKESLTSRPELENRIGQKRSSWPRNPTSGLPRKADSYRTSHHDRFVPQTDMFD